jgi:membrane-associated protease RseP (regulator of RpoE activity)
LEELMRLATLKTSLLTFLLLASTASRLRAAGDPPAPPAPPPPPAVPAPRAPAPPDPTGREVVIDGDRIILWDCEEDPELVATLSGTDDDEPNVLLRGHGARGFIGIRLIEMTEELRAHFGAPKDAGVLVGTVESESPAAKAGLKVGDIITAVDGEKIDSTRDLLREVRRHKAGETVKLDVTRDRSSKPLSVTLAERKERETLLGDLDRGMSGFRWKDFDHFRPHRAPLPMLPEFGDLQKRLEEVEQRLKDLESRMKNR